MIANEKVSQDWKCCSIMNVKGLTMDEYVQAFHPVNKEWVLLCCHNGRIVNRSEKKFENVFVVHSGQMLRDERERINT